MNATLSRHQTRPALAAAALLLVSGCLGVAASQTDRPLAPTQLQDASPPEAGSTPTAPSPTRRLNSSLSMPYFSFAQSLNSRS